MNDRKYYSLLLFFVLSLAWRLCPAQSTPNTEMRCVLQLDKSFYVTGEVVWYRISSPRQSGFDRAAVEVTVQNKEGQVVDRHFQRLREGEADGYLSIPYDWESGIYHLTFSANRPDASVVELVAAPVPIYNDLTFTSDSAYTAARRPAGLTPSIQKQDLFIRIETEQPSYHPREAVRATIEVRDVDGPVANAFLSVAVVDALLCGEATGAFPSIHYGPAMPEAPRLSQQRMLSGWVADQEDQPLRTIYLAAFQPTTHQLLFTRSDSSGRFHLELPDFYGQQPLQLFDYKSPDIQVDLSRQQEAPPSASLPFNETIDRYLQLSRRRKKIHQVFQTLSMPLNPTFPPVDTGRFIPDQKLRIADYDRMESLPAFFREVSTPLKFRQKEGAYVARMFNPGRRARRFYPDDPLFIVDGRLTRDADFVAGLDIKEIEQIDLFFDSDNLRKQFGALGRHGVIRIISLTGSFQIPEGKGRNIFQVEGFQPPAGFPGVDFGAGGTPLFRPQLWWSPLVKCDEQGRAGIEFQNADSRSIFRIIVLARDAAGKIGMSSASYEVSGSK